MWTQGQVNASIPAFHILLNLLYISLDLFLPPLDLFQIMLLPTLELFLPPLDLLHISPDLSLLLLSLLHTLLELLEKLEDLTFLVDSRSVLHCAMNMICYVLVP